MNAWLRQTGARWLLTILVLGTLPVIGIWRWTSRGHPAGLVISLWAVILFWVMFLALLEWAGHGDDNPARRKYGYLNIVIGADGRVSTSKTVAAMWTAALGSALVLLCGMLVFGKLANARDAFGPSSTWDGYFLLLGGPFASAVLAKGIVSSRVSQDPLAKTSLSSASETSQPAPIVAGTPSSKDVVAGDGGTVDLIDTQFALFTMIAVLYFVGAFAANVDKFAVKREQVIGLPAIPSALLGLTSLAALTYVGNKAVQTQGLRGVTLSPPSVGSGGTVVARLVNLPTTADQSNVTVLIKDSQGVVQAVAPTLVDPAGKTVSFLAPGSPGQYTVTISGPDTYTPPAALAIS